MSAADKMHEIFQTAFTCADTKQLLAVCAREIATKDNGALAGHASFWKETLKLLLRTLGLHDADWMVGKPSTDGVKNSTCCTNKPGLLFRSGCFSFNLRTVVSCFYLITTSPLSYSHPAPNLNKLWRSHKDKKDDEWAAQFPDSKDALAERIKNYFAANHEFAKYDRAQPVPPRGVHITADAESEEQDNCTEAGGSGALDCDTAVRCIRTAVFIVLFFRFACALVCVLQYVAQHSATRPHISQYRATLRNYIRPTPFYQFTRRHRPRLPRRRLLPRRLPPRRRIRQPAA